MAKHNQKGFGAVEIIVIILVLCLIGGAAWYVLGAKKKDASPQKDQSQSQTTETADEPTPDTEHTIAIPEWGVAIATGTKNDIDYTVKTSDDGTAYISLTTQAVKGSTCVDDTGSIGSILKNPPATAQSYVAAQKSLDGTEYAWTPGGDNCAPDKEVLKEYQAAIKDNLNQISKL
ncbi:MAG: hypothetical protein WBP26_01890 [Candidatus Saccharimonadales bacterium]